jgi:hypothetical protein
MDREKQELGDKSNSLQLASGRERDKWGANKKAERKKHTCESNLTFFLLE